MYVSTPLPEEDDDAVDNDFYLLGKTYFDCKEYRRAAHVLRDQTGRKAVFLRCYALYLAGEKRKEEELIELEGPLGKSNVVNLELTSIEGELSLLRKRGVLDPFGLYLYAPCSGVVVECVNNYPWNWNAWQTLQSLCTSIDSLNSLNLNSHWMKDFFLASAYEDLRLHKESLANNYIQARIANVQYHLREFDLVENIFDELMTNDPYRIEDMDLYSNVLYAKEAFSALSYLAHKVFLTDKYRPESCCIVGNYYSSKGQHEKAVLYFRRALKLNKNYLSAWTLMGHEFVELQNTAAAVDAYRRAVDINSCDYRAWYGLGQAYEMMMMPLYALHYFRKSVFLQPNDPRLWIAMAHCYESNQLHMLEEAIKCYKRAADQQDTEAIAVNRLAKLHDQLGNKLKPQGPNMVDALMFLAKYYRFQKHVDEAEIYCTRLLDYAGPILERSHNLNDWNSDKFTPYNVC
ncbi:hypothetical protein RND81_01G085000 [Saponaria officinalis]|uniref:Cdc23 domain-containing protein n=1 Tax=Saponaria officinalis TaxID=3572 RepID=A0AAW1NDN0_SAPOF